MFHNKEILIGGKPVLFQEWPRNQRCRTVMDLLDSEGNFISFAAFKSKFQRRRSPFLHFYQVKSHLLVRASELSATAENDTLIFYNYDGSVRFSFNVNSFLDLEKAKAKDFYWLIASQ